MSFTVPAAEADQEIDARVYALYGLGEGEMRVVEG